MNHKPELSIVTLTKNDNCGFNSSFFSLLKQDFKGNIEWIIVDGSNKKQFNYNAKSLKSQLVHFKDKIPFGLDLHHIFLSKEIINGIYGSMNYGIKMCNGRSIIFLNGGDEFYNSNSIRLLLDPHQKNNFFKTVSFGQANIISEFGINWLFPGNKLSKIYYWLKYFEPNHQAMLVSSDIAKNVEFEETSKISADKFWKRKVISLAKNVVYIRKPVCKFKLDGLSSKRPTFKILKQEIQDKKISNLRKIIIFIRFLIIPFFYKYIPFLQKFKSFIVDLIF